MFSQLAQRRWPCPKCEHDLVSQLLAGIGNCPGCGRRIPVIFNRADNPATAPVEHQDAERSQAILAAIHLPSAPHSPQS